MPPNPTQNPETTRSKPQATESLHADFLEAAMPAWLIEATTQRRQAIKQAGTQMPAWYANASPEQRKVVDACFTQSVAAQNRLDKTLSAFLDIVDPGTKGSVQDRSGRRQDVAAPDTTVGNIRDQGGNFFVHSVQVAPAASCAAQLRKLGMRA
jgi:hypothetical protein